MGADVVLPEISVCEDDLLMEEASKATAMVSGQRPVEIANEDSQGSMGQPMNMITIRWQPLEVGRGCKRPMETARTVRRPRGQRGDRTENRDQRGLRRGL